MQRKLFCPTHKLCSYYKNSIYKYSILCSLWEFCVKTCNIFLLDSYRWCWKSKIQFSDYFMYARKAVCAVHCTHESQCVYCIRCLFIEFIIMLHDLFFDFNAIFEIRFECSENFNFSQFYFYFIRLIFVVFYWTRFGIFLIFFY